MCEMVELILINIVQFCLKSLRILKCCQKINFSKKLFPLISECKTQNAHN